MARIILLSAGEPVEMDALSTSHVRSNQDGTIELDVPFYTKEGGAQSVRLLLTRAEALMLAGRLTNTVAHHLEATR